MTIVTFLVMMYSAHRPPGSSRDWQKKHLSLWRNAESMAFYLEPVRQVSKVLIQNRVRLQHDFVDGDFIDGSLSTVTNSQPIRITLRRKKSNTAMAIRRQQYRNTIMRVFVIACGKWLMIDRCTYEPAKLATASSSSSIGGAALLSLLLSYLSKKWGNGKRNENVNYHRPHSCPTKILNYFV